MKLYEVNQQILELLDRLEPDPETGEIPADEDAIIAEINALAMQRQEILQYLAKLVLNARAEAAMLKAEEQRLKVRRAAMENREQRIMGILDRECGGEKTDLGVAVFSYRRSPHLEVEDPGKAIRWLKRNKHMDCFRVREPEVAKTEVTRLINSGVHVPGCSVVYSNSCSLK